MTSLPDGLACCARSGALEQRARLLEAIWRDVSSGRQSMLPTVLTTDRAWSSAPIDDYAVDLVLAPDRVWRVLRDHVGGHGGAGLLEAPLLAVFLPELCRALLGQSLLLPSWPTFWLSDADARAQLAARPARFCLGDALDPEAESVALATASADGRAILQRRMDAAPDRTIVRLDPSGNRVVRMTGRLPPCKSTFTIH